MVCVYDGHRVVFYQFSVSYNIESRIVSFRPKQAKSQISGHFYEMRPRHRPSWPVMLYRGISMTFAISRRGLNQSGLVAPA